MANESSSGVNRSGAAGAPQFLLYREAFERVLPATAALSEEELIAVNIDVPSAVATAIGALPKIMAYREEAAKLYAFDVSHFDLLQLYTFAVGHAHAKLLAASAPPEALSALNERGVKLRDTMYLDAVALAHRGLISGDRLSDFKDGTGYKNLAFDLLGLSSLLRDNWDKIASRTGIQLSELDDAELLGQQLMDAVGTREQAPATVAQVQAQRQGNFTLFSRSYDQVRRAISYLRWDEEDVDQICPSLYAGRGGRRKEAAPAASVPETIPPPADAGSSAKASDGGAAGAGAAGGPLSNLPTGSGVGSPGSQPFLTER